MNAAQQAIRTSVRRLDRQLKPLKHRAPIEGVHEARAAARMIGDTLSAFDTRLPVLKQQAALLMEALGKVRDLHVSGVRQGSKLTRATAKMRQVMTAWDRVRPLINREISEAAQNASPKKLLRRRLRRLDKRIQALPSRVPAKKAHRLRVKTKRARTAVELVAPQQKRLLEKLKKASAVLGTLHDLDAGLDTAGHSRKHWVHEVMPVLEKLRSEL